MIFTFSNIISLLRAPLAILFLAENPLFKTLAIILAMLTDWLDGFLARKYHTTSRLGTILDPLMDKFFVGVLLVYFYFHGQIDLWQVVAFLARDLALLCFGLYLLLVGLWGRFTFRAIWFGKLFTTIQFIILLALTYRYTIPDVIFYFLGLLGLLAFLELYRVADQNR